MEESYKTLMMQYGQSESGWWPLLHVFPSLTSILLHLLSTQVKKKNTKNTKKNSPLTYVHLSTYSFTVAQVKTPDSWLCCQRCRHHVFPQTCLLFDWELKADSGFSCRPLSNLSLLPVSHSSV